MALKNLAYTPIIVFNYLFSVYVCIRQISKLSQKISPSAKKLSTEEHFSLSCKYNKEKILFSIFQESFSALESIALLVTAEQIYKAFTTKVCKNDVLFMMLYIAFSMITNLPFGFYKDFVIEARYGFNKKTIGLFIQDFFLELSISSAILFPLLIAVKYIINNFPNFPIYITLLMTIFKVFLIIIYPNFITPLYNKVTQLENLVLKEKVEKMAQKVNFTIDRIEVIDGSKRSGHSNAYFIGIGKAKRIVFYDTILNQMNDDEILAVLCHELGHWHHSHILINSVISSVLIFVYSTAFKRYFGAKTAFKYNEKGVIFCVLASVFGIPMTFLMNYISRVFERQADRFAVKHGYGKHLISGLIKLSTENMGSPVVDSLYSAMVNSHPHITERIESIEQEMRKNE